MPLLFWPGGHARAARVDGGLRLAGGARWGFRQDSAGRQGPHPGPDERVVGGERGADRRVGGLLGDGQRGLQQPARLRRRDLRERGRGLAAVVEELADLRGDPAVPGQAAGVVVDDHDERVLLLPGVAEHADDLVAVAVGVGVHVALGRDDRADVLGPARPGDAALHQRQGRLLGAGRLPRRAQAGDAGQQGQRGRAALLGRVGDQALADQLLDVGAPAPDLPASRARGALAPPGAEQLADHQLGVERAAHGQQLARGPEHLGEQRVGRRRCGRGGRPLPGGT